MDRVGGIELGGTKVRCAIGTGPGQVEVEIRIPTADPDSTMAAVVGFFRLHPPLPAAIGVGCFGPLDLRAEAETYGHIRDTPKPGWSGISVLDSLAVLEVPLHLTTDVAAALAGELQWGAAQKVSDAVYITVGTGIGGAATVEGHCVGARSHPELGHIAIPREADDALQRGTCPFHPDCLEGWASGPAIEARWGASAASLPDDHPAWDLEARYLAQGLRSVALMLAPVRIVVGGGIGLRAALLDRVRGHLDRVMGGYGGLGPSAEWVVPAALGEDAGLLGAMAIAGTGPG